MGSLAQILPLILMFVLFYFLLIRPQQKRQKATQNMQSSLKKGDKVATIGGMHGTIDAIDELQIVIKSPDGTKLTFDRAAIREITESAPNKETSL
ncbi:MULTISPECIES: preprotein translocase subunit YajC [Bacillaceae]|jgi:preprotein translocase subunit YajC|uniref:preprotein translocase subunit YajC n=1 Tax=Bacillaceae TaxID=186817 RepID=UPI001BEAA17F|nr:MULTISPECIES: preprotein translocase subunit YajC [Bacillaceae]MBT2718120.1 preprotein translocase subunit YajC [Bacillus sp. ISL-57]MCK1981900.1 preprotein translocase subunit YajC [Peribacillus sp. Aquil_B1]MCK2010056.1 preprotein translocase subunit YajC [Peribacillus sp. Aquil_B8]